MSFVAFLLLFFNIYLCLIFVILINMCLGMFLFGLILYGTLWASCTWVAISFPMLGKFSTMICSNIFSYPFFNLPLLGPLNSKVGTLNVFPEVSETVLIFFILFSLFYSASVISTILSVHLSTLLPQLFCYWFPLEFFISVIMVLIVDCQATAHTFLGACAVWHCQGTHELGPVPLEERMTCLRL